MKALKVENNEIAFNQQFSVKKSPAGISNNNVNVGEVTVSEKNSVKAWTILSTALLFYLYEYVLRVSPSVMTAELMMDYSITAKAVGVLAAFYYYAYVPLQIPGGVIVDRIGPRRVIAFSALLCGAGCIFFAASHNLMLAQMGRFMMGAGSACAYLSCMKLAADWFDASKFAMIAGFAMFMGTMGGTFGGSPFAMMINTMGYESTMYFAGFFGFFVAALSWFIIRDYPKGEEKHSNATNSSQGLLDGLKIITSKKHCWLMGLYGCAMYLPLSAFAELWGVPYLKKMYGITNDVAAQGSIMVFIGMGIGCIIASWVSDKIQNRKKVMMAAAIGTFTCFMLIFHGPAISFNEMLILLFVTGLISGGQILYFASNKEVNPKEISATSIGFTNALLMMSGVIFQPLLGWILDYSWDGNLNPDGTPLYTLADYKEAFSAVLFALVAGFFLITMTKDSYHQSVQS